jgi:uncharacterized protein YkwD
LLAALFGVAMAHADDSSELVTRINAYRQSAATCAGQQSLPLTPLVADDRLARVQVRSTEQLQSALQQAGYQFAAVQVIGVAGPANPDTAMKAIEQRHCSTLLDPQYVEIGVLRNANSWQLVLARPLLPRELGDWQTAGKEILKWVNAARDKPRRCGSRAFEAAPALSWNARLARSALAHSRDMAARNYFSHQGKDGSLADGRATRDGYKWRAIGENIAAGEGSAQQVVAGWLASPSHCFNIMNPDFTEMGAAYAVNPQSDAAIYWTQVFGTPR